MSIDYENGVSYLSLKGGDIDHTISLNSPKGIEYLKNRSANIALDFDKDDKLVGIELLGL